MLVGETVQETVTPSCFPVKRGQRGKKGNTVPCLHCVGWPPALDVHVVNSPPWGLRGGVGGGCLTVDCGSKPFRHWRV